MNAKMFLCAVVDGEEHDLQKMHKVIPTMHDVRCPCNMDPPQTISLYMYGFGGRPMGRVGRCPICGRIYYSEVK